MEDRKPVVKAADMSEDMQRDAFECAATVRVEGACWMGLCVLLWRLGVCRRLGDASWVRVNQGACATGKKGSVWRVWRRPGGARAVRSARVVSVFGRKPTKSPPPPRPSTSTPSRRTSRPTSSASSTSGTRPRGTAWSGATLVRVWALGGKRERRGDKQTHELDSLTHPPSTGSFVTHETKCFVYFYLGHLAVLLFKSG